MPYDEHLTERLRHSFSRLHIPYVEKKMFGGICFMVDDKMCIGVHKDILMARLDPDNYEDTFKRPGCRPMDFTGRPMRGYIFVDPEGIDLDEELDYYVERALEFNPRAKSSKSKKRSK